MGLISREATAPIQDGETASGAEVENEFNKIFNEINGNLDNANVKSAAAIDGSKIANTSITTTQIAADTVARSNINADAFGTASYESNASDAGTTMTTSTSYVAIDSITTVSVTPDSTDDFIVVDLAVVGDVTTAASTDKTLLEFRLTVDGTEHELGSHEWRGDSRDGTKRANFFWAGAAPATTSIDIIPQFKVNAQAGSYVKWAAATDGINKAFRVLVFPVKT
jgi:hypothetical protein